MKLSELINIFTVYPKKEPLRLVYCRGCVAVTLLLALIAYLFLQAYQVAQLQTIISQNIDTELIIPFPDVTFTSEIQFNISCNYQSTSNYIVSASTKCNKFLTPMEKFIPKHTQTLYYRMNFTAGRNAPVQYSSHNLTTVQFNIRLTDPTFLRNDSRFDFDVIIVDTGNFLGTFLSKEQIFRLFNFLYSILTS